MSALGWETIFRDAVSAVAGVCVYEKPQRDILGKFVVAKTMKLKNGKTRHTQSYFVQRPAALRRARKFLQQRAKMFGREYIVGDGKNTLAYSPIFPKENHE